jgi:hypothetical protein
MSLALPLRSEQAEKDIFPLIRSLMWPSCTMSLALVFSLVLFRPVLHSQKRHNSNENLPMQLQSASQGVYIPVTLSTRQKHLHNPLIKAYSGQYEWCLESHLLNLARCKLFLFLAINTIGFNNYKGLVDAFDSAHLFPTEVGGSHPQLVLV